MNLTQIAEQKAHEMLKEYADLLPNLTPQAIAELAFMRGAAWEAGRNIIMNPKPKAVTLSPVSGRGDGPPS